MAIPFRSNQNLEWRGARYAGPRGFQLARRAKSCWREETHAASISGEAKELGRAGTPGHRSTRC
jgi:hypothetical protein